VLETAIEEKRKREELKAKRDLLFERYLKHPMDTRLASVRNQDYRRSASGRYQANEREDKQPELSPVQMTLSCPVDSEVKSHFQNVSLAILEFRVRGNSTSPPRGDPAAVVSSSKCPQLA